MFTRLIIKEWHLIILFVLSLVVMLLCKMDVSFAISFDWQDFIKNSLFSIAGGYIAGFIFYVVSVLHPKSKRISPILELAGHQIRYAKDAINEMSYNIGGKLEFEKLSFKLKIVEKKSYDNYEIDYSKHRVILQGLQNVHALIQYPISVVEFLESDDICELSTILRLLSKNITMLKDYEPNKVVNISEDGLDSFVNDINKCYMLLNKTYNRLKKRVGYGEKEDIV